jgi:hypothetical protein
LVPPTIPSVSVESKPESGDNNKILDPSYKGQSAGDRDEGINKHRSRYTTHMEATVGKVLHDTQNKDIITPDEVFIPAKRMNAPHLSNRNNIIGGILPTGDPYETTAQQMQTGTETEKKFTSRKKTLKEFEPELFVSPITGEQIANYGTWADDLKQQHATREQAQVVDESPDDPLMAKLKSQLNARGAKGMIGLGRLFRIMDDDGSGSLSFQEFKKAMQDIGLGLNDVELIVLFKRFDVSGKQSISYNDFLTTVAVSTQLYFDSTLVFH